MDDHIVCIFKCGSDYFLECLQEGGIRGYEDFSGVLAWDKAYNQAFKRGNQGVMSACISYIGIQPSFTTLSMEKMESLVENKSGKMTVYRLYPGNRHGLKLWDTTESEHAWESGIQPQLVKVK